MKNYMTSKTGMTIAAAAIALASVLTACKGKSEDTQTVEQKNEAKTEYVCPMHPDQVSDKPGTCAICKMDLVEKKAEEKTEQHQH